MVHKQDNKVVHRLDNKVVHRLDNKVVHRLDNKVASNPVASHSQEILQRMAKA